MKLAPLALALFAALATAQTPAPKDVSDAEKTFTACKALVGGVWRGTLGGKLPVALTFTLIHDGKVILGKGIVGDPEKPVMTMTSHIGIDPASKSVYYLDQHGADVVYFGHCQMEGEWMKFDFRGMSADTGHYIAKERVVGKDQFETSLFVVDDSGKESKLHDLKLERKAK